jgi:hypothetical protein
MRRGLGCEAGVEDPEGRVIAVTARRMPSNRASTNLILQFAESVGGRFSLWFQSREHCARTGWDAFEALPKVPQR